uniref:Uncharacterized protein n=1 Tax=Candidatus Kentrum sp. FW TaxID=2126338 RepID=A0A450TQX8_9GAMM|nr:MAG: hypothetical protein BECKFW1821C_GA0114237_102327 [Candidatus Kentron sp. FW]
MIKQTIGKLLEKQAVQALKGNFMATKYIYIIQIVVKIIPWLFVFRIKNHPCNATAGEAENDVPICPEHFTTWEILHLRGAMRLPT